MKLWLRKIMKIGGREIRQGIVVGIVPSVLLLAVVAASPTISVMPHGWSIVRVFTRGFTGKKSIKLAYVDAAAMYGEFECSCCGKNISECDCGMAKERRAFVEGLAASGLSKRGIYKEMVKKYTVDILFNEALAAEIKNELIAEAPADRPILEIEPSEVDAGEISMAKGRIKKIFRVRNGGQSELEISGMEASCMCTTALLRVRGKNSPIFGMHDNPTDWLTKLAPGEEAELVLFFDPNAHGPEAVGPVTRTVTIHSNDVIEADKKVTFKAVVVR